MMKKLLDIRRGEHFSSVIYSSGHNDLPELRKYHKTKKEVEDEIELFKDPEHPLKILIVQNMLLTGFDAPIEQVMYLDRPLKDHSLLQAVARTNRPYPNKKCGIIVDYCGVLKNLNKALNFDESEIDHCLIEFDKLKEDLPQQLEEFKSLFENVYLSNLAHCLKHIEDNDLGEEVKQKFKQLQLTYDTLSPDPFILDYDKDYAWAAKLVLAYNQLQSQEKPDISEYLPHTQKLIQDRIDLKEVNETAPVFKIDDNYLSRLDGKALSKELREMTLEHRIRSILRVKVGDLPVYKTLLERLEALIKRKSEESKDTMVLLESLFKDVVKAKTEDESSGETRGFRAIKQLIEPKLANNIELADEISGKIDEKIKSLTGFPDWQLQETVKAKIKMEIIILLAQYSQQKQDLSIGPDEMSSFVNEMLSYIQEHY